MNLRALAIQKNPGLFSRAMGRRFSPRGIQRNPGLFSRAMGRRFASRGHVLTSDIIYKGDDEALRQYIQEHKRELQSEAVDLRDKRKATTS